ncbi:MAG: hypothetical protein LBJ95_01230 [Oscillospiraceae bacterium]|jgi:bacteriocin-like protein|nr:hypothetical protein [Oscillospiraceae bacterium]
MKNTNYMNASTTPQQLDEQELQAISGGWDGPRLSEADIISHAVKIGKIRLINNDPDVKYQCCISGCNIPDTLALSLHSTKCWY